MGMDELRFRHGGEIMITWRRRQPDQVRTAIISVLVAVIVLLVVVFSIAG